MSISTYAATVGLHFVAAGSSHGWGPKIATIVIFLVLVALGIWWRQKHKK